MKEQKTENRFPAKPWKDKRYAFYSHRECEAFPCHTEVDTENFNCLFCYCPLYALGASCGGAPVYLKNGVKDCSNCTLPHERDNYGIIVGKFEDIVKAMSHNPS
jgi:Zn-finger protein